MKRLLFAGCAAVAVVLAAVILDALWTEHDRAHHPEDYAWHEDDDGVQPTDPRTLPPDFEHRPVIVFDSAIQCSCGARLVWPPGWRHTFENARVLLVGPHTLPR